MKVRVIDSIMGSGKSTYIMKYLQEEHEREVRWLHGGFTDVRQLNRYMIVVPLLTEAARYVDGCRSLGLKEPLDTVGTKSGHLLKLVSEGANVVTTHSLFSKMGRELWEALGRQRYRLVVDEEPQCVSTFQDLTASDFDLLNSRGVLKVDPVSKRLRWDADVAGPHYQGVFDPIRDLCRDDSLAAVGQTLYWALSPEALRCFREVTVCTYLHRGSFFDAWLTMEGFDVELLTLDRGELRSMDRAPNEAAIKRELKSKIDVYDGSRNNIGMRQGNSEPLSVSWFQRAKDTDLKALKQSTETYFDKVAHCPTAEAGWTVFKAYQHKVKGRGYTKGFIPSNAKATNDYAAKAALAYLINWFCSPPLTRLFDARGVKVDADRYALSALLQWMWRSRIREGKPIKVFIPSERMRTLFERWLNDTSEVHKGEEPTSIACRSVA